MTIKVRSNGQSLDDYVREAAIFRSKANDLAEIEPGYYTPDSNNGYPPDDIILNGLVFYAPLWQSKGSKFKSIDPYHHTCTVTGATWGSQGRTFNGTTNRIQTGASSLLSSPTSLSICHWIYPTNTADNKASLSHRSAGGDNWDWYYALSSATTFGFRYWTSGAVFKDCSSAYTIPTTSFSFCVTTFDGTNARHYFNTVLVATVNQPGAINTSSQALTIGDDGFGTAYMGGRIGEAIIYNRVLSIAEIQHNNLATRWRYK